MSGVVVWFTGLPASGKTTLAKRVAAALKEPACLLDSDDIRAAMVPSPMYDDQGRSDFYATLANLAALLAEQELVVLVAATANLRKFRAVARERARVFLEVHVTTPVEECARRDPKGLYRAARGDDATTLPGVGAVFETPLSPDAVARGGHDDEALSRIVAVVRRVFRGAT